MIRRETNPEVVNAMIGRDFPGVDYSEVLSEPLHVCLVDGDSGAIFAWRGPGTYEAHMFFAVRGRTALRLAHDMLDHMKLYHGARRFWTLFEPDAIARKFVRLLGWTSKGLVETRHGPNELYTLEIA